MSEQVGPSKSSKLAVEWVPVSKLVLNPANPRQNDDAVPHLAGSLKRFGWQQPVVARRSGVVIAGNTRLKAAMSLGMTEVPVVWFDGSDIEATAYGIADNKTHEFSTWDDAALVKLLGELRAEDALDGVGFTNDDIDALLDQLEEQSGEDVEDPGPEASPIVPVSRTGDLWILRNELGEHRVLCGDSTKVEDVERVMAGDEADLVVTSPPYNCGKDYGTHDDSMATQDYLNFVAAVIRRCFDVTRKGRMLAWNVGVSPASLPFEHASRALAAGLRFVREIVWQKVGVAFPIWNTTIDRPAARNYHPNYQHELIYLFSKGEIEVGERCEVDDDCSSDVWTVHQSQATRDVPGATNGRKDRVAEHGGFKDAAHPAVYPIEIPQRLIRHLSARDEIVLDPFSGAGSTLIAAEKLARYCRAIEIEPAYVDVSVRRWEKATGRAATLEATGESFADVAAERGVALKDSAASDAAATAPTRKEAAREP